MLLHEKAEWYERNKEERGLKRELKRLQIETRPKYQEKYDQVMNQMEEIKKTITEIRSLQPRYESINGKFEFDHNLQEAIEVLKKDYESLQHFDWITNEKKMRKLEQEGEGKKREHYDITPQEREEEEKDLVFSNDFDVVEARLAHQIENLKVSFSTLLEYTKILDYKPDIAIVRTLDDISTAMSYSTKTSLGLLPAFAKRIGSHIYRYMSKIPIPEIPEIVAPPLKPDAKPTGEIHEIAPPKEEGLIVAYQPMHEPLFQPVGLVGVPHPHPLPEAPVPEPEHHELEHLSNVPAHLSEQQEQQALKNFHALQSSINLNTDEDVI